ncbi:MAG: hypothetical protein KBD21_05310 [Candidatus Pacebacteria bacterium]|nr:hypothetical protein [Candidatus Paceibacterota bacterium]
MLKPHQRWGFCLAMTQHPLLRFHALTRTVKRPTNPAVLAIVMVRVPHRPIEKQCDSTKYEKYQRDSERIHDLLPTAQQKNPS